MSRTMDTYYPEWMDIIVIIGYMCILTSSERQDGSPFGFTLSPTLAEQQLLKQS